MEKIPNSHNEIPLELLERFIDAMLSTQQGQSRLGFIPRPDKYKDSPFQCDVPISQEEHELLAIGQDRLLKKITTEGTNSRTISLESNGFNLVSTVMLHGFTLSLVTKPSSEGLDEFAHYVSFFYFVAHSSEY